MAFSGWSTTAASNTAAAIGNGTSIQFSAIYRV